ncbi:MAG: deoxyribose-phosphate aldolase [Candidatus Korobacteraceae bacterium]
MSVDAAVLAGIPAVAISDWRSAAQLIDHTLLAPDATRTQLISHCSDARSFGFHSVVVNPCYVAAAAAQLSGTSVKVATVVGFPLGASLTMTKLGEAEAALHNGARELDMVINIGALKSGDRVLLQTEMRLMAKLAHEGKALLKVILENALLTQKEKILACALAMEAGADFVKTSTGFAPSGATAADVALMRGVVGHALGVKAAGGIRSAADLKTMLDAGANRIGTSAGTIIVRELGAPQ